MAYKWQFYDFGAMYYTHYIHVYKRIQNTMYIYTYIYIYIYKPNRAKQKVLYVYNIKQKGTYQAK